MDACESYDYNPGSIIRHKNNSTKKLHAGGNLGRGVRRLEPQAPAVADRMQFFYSTSSPSRTSSSVFSISASSVDQVSRRVMTEAVIRRTMPTMVFQ